ncbi:MAG TPA: HAD family hydrolase [Aeromicrobium sp.]|nr:HAD family hydrolase [Aeromicrobium sp.]
MTFRPKLVALDVDGTVVDEENRISPAVARAVRAVVDAGIHVVVSTGRAVPGALEVVERLELPDGMAVCSNGAVLIGFRPLEILEAITFDASEAVRRVVERVPDAFVAVEEIGVGYRVNQPFPSGEIAGTITIEEVDSLIAEPVTRVIVRAPTHDPEEFHDLVEGLGLTDINYYIGYTAWLDLAPMGVSKASALSDVGDRLGIGAEDVLAVGDGFNDVEMLEWAGRGVAMGHAPDRLKDVADDVTGTVHEDGLARELQKYL